MSWSEPKYFPGERIDDLTELLAVLDAGAWLYAGRRVYHPSIIGNWSLQTVRRHLRAADGFRRAKPNPRYRQQPTTSSATA